MGFFLNQPDPYFTEAEAILGRMLSSKDWVLVESWQKRGIPLRVVARTVEDCLKAKPDIRSLVYCEKAVEREFGEWQKSQVGKSVDVEVNCLECGDSKQTPRRVENGEYAYPLEYVACGESL